MLSLLLSHGINKKKNQTVEYWYACYDQAGRAQELRYRQRRQTGKLLLRVAQEYEDAVREARLGVLVESFSQEEH